MDSKYKQTTLVIQTRYPKLQWLLELLPPFCIAKVPLSVSYLWHRSTFSCSFSFIFVSNGHATAILWHSPVCLSAIKMSGLSTPNIIIHFFNQVWGAMANVFLQLSMLFQALLSVSYNFLISFYQLIIGRLSPFIFLDTPFVPLPSMCHFADGHAVHQ